MKVLLTGITGFVGQNLMPMLLKQCPDNVFLTLNIDVDDAVKKFPSALYPNFKHVHTTDLTAVKEFNPDLILHLATITTSSNDTAIIHPMISANIEFGVLLLDVLKDCSNFKLFVNTGSFGEFMHDSDHYESAYLYTATKTAFRAFLNYYSSLAGFKYINGVPYTVYGGNMTVKRIMDYIMESLDSPTPIGMTAGEQVLDFVHVNDVASFFIYVINNFEKAMSLDNGANIYLGTGKGTSIRQLAALIEAREGKKCNIAWGERPYRERDIMYAVAPIEKNLKLGWKASISLSDSSDPANH